MKAEDIKVGESYSNGKGLTRVVRKIEGAPLK